MFFHGISVYLPLQDMSNQSWEDCEWKGQEWVDDTTAHGSTQWEHQEMALKCQWICFNVFQCHHAHVSTICFAGMGHRDQG